MNYNPADYNGQLDFLDMKYLCPITYCGFTFSSLWQAAKVLRCDDQIVWQIALSGDDEEIVNQLEREICEKHIDIEDYQERLIQITLKKYNSVEMYNRLYCRTDEGDVFNYGKEDPTGVIGKATALIRNGETNSLYISEKILGEK